MKQLALMVSMILGLGAAGETTAGRSARGSFQPTGRTNMSVRSARMARRPRRHPARVQYVINDQAFANPSALTAPAPVRRHYFSGMIVQVAAGLNAGYAASNAPATGSTRNAMAFSLMFEKKLDDRFYLCPEIAYVQRGVVTNLANFGGVSVVGNVQLNYLEIPLLLKAKFGIAPRWKVFVVGGPTAGVILNRQVEVLGLVNLDLGNRFRQADFGFVLGTGVEFQLTPEITMMGHLRSQTGLVNLDQTPDTTFYTRGIQLLLGAQFRL